MSALDSYTLLNFLCGAVSYSEPSVSETLNLIFSDAQNLRRFQHGVHLNIIRHLHQLHLLPAAHHIW